MVSGQWSVGSVKWEVWSAENIKRKKHAQRITSERFFPGERGGVKLSTSDRWGNLFLLAGLIPKAEPLRSVRQSLTSEF